MSFLAIEHALWQGESQKIRKLQHRVLGDLNIANLGTNCQGENRSTPPLTSCISEPFCTSISSCKKRVIMGSACMG